MKLTIRNFFLWIVFASGLVLLGNTVASARPSKTKTGSNSITSFRRQTNTLSNIDFYFTNKGVLFNDDQVAGLHWPRGSSNAYVFGGGLWFATKFERR